jgi:hypothetical protein
VLISAWAYRSWLGCWFVPISAWWWSRGFARRSRPGRGGGAVGLLDDLDLGVGLCRSRRGGGAVGVIEGRDEERGKKKERCYEEREKKLK